MVKCYYHLKSFLWRISAKDITNIFFFYNMDSIKHVDYKQKGRYFFNKTVLYGGGSGEDCKPEHATMVSHM